MDARPRRVTVVGVSDDDDLDWLYRRGQYTEPGQAPRNPAGGSVDRASGARAEYRDTPRRQPSPTQRPEPQQRPQPTQQYARAPQGTPRPQQPAPPTPTPVAGARRPRRKRPRILTILGLVVVAMLAYLIGVPVVAASGMKKVDAAPAGARPSDQPGQLFLLAGSDSREGLTPEERSKLGTGSTEGQRTDTIMLLYIPPSGKPALISVPRDSFVEIPGHKKNKINAAYAIGGPKLLTETIEQSTGLRVDGYAEIGFGGFVNMIDAVGGIEMCLKEPIKDKDSHLDVPAGCQTMDGVTALGYVRMRKADPRGDLGRVERQRQMLAALAKKLATPMTVINPVRYWSVTHAGASSLTTGNDTGVVDLARLGFGFMGIAGGDGLTLTVPIANSAAHTSAGSAVLWNEKRAKEMFDAIANGDTAKLEQFKK